MALPRDAPNWINADTRGNRVPVYGWSVDERTGTFVAMSQNDMDSRAGALMAAATDRIRELHAGVAGVGAGGGGGGGGGGPSRPSQQQQLRFEAWQIKLGDESEDATAAAASTDKTRAGGGGAGGGAGPAPRGPAGSAGVTPVVVADAVAGALGGTTTDQHARRAAKSTSVEARCPRASFLLRNTMRAPIAEMGATDLRLGVGAQVRGCGVWVWGVWVMGSEGGGGRGRGVKA